ncbi:CHAP domain-containing protein [Actinacidiphila oryziradicis]|uniref:CHAP domain-containing protein n=1 Tax=Actinacidiphila oryziradicis TaxID=2571141 RepID=A0A4U0SGW3_9ACTN|nr:CHAP domain-containing protein [Actinacidiphila oryziradicis]TKA08884.1 CHAP domain-containing protein [Actinacidiphila oryziradicis]
MFANVRAKARTVVVIGTIGTALLVGPVASATTYQITGTSGAGVNARSAPSTSASIVGHYAEGAAIDITCQTNGSVVNGATWVWDKLSNGSYVSDYYTTTPTLDNFSINLPNCAGTQSELNPAYPWPGVGPSTYIADGYGYYEGECTSFAAWAVRNDGLHHVSSSSWLGNANTWSAAKVESSPHVGDIAQWYGNVNGAGSGGHVAYVSEVYGDGTIQVEEYNWLSSYNGYTGHRYNTRRISVGAPSRYLQF